MCELKTVREIESPFNGSSMEAAIEDLFIRVGMYQPEDASHLVLATIQVLCEFATQFVEDLPELRKEAIEMWEGPTHFGFKEQRAQNLEINLEALELFFAGINLELLHQTDRCSHCKPVVDRLLHNLWSVEKDFNLISEVANEMGLLQRGARGLFLTWGQMLVRLQGLHDDPAEPS